MRVWLWQDKEYGDVGASRWLVSWWTVTPKAKARVEAAEAAGKLDEYDPDADIVENDKAFPPGAKGRKAAMAFAKRAAGVELTAYGCAKVVEQVVVHDEATPAGVGEWVSVGEAVDV